MTDSSQSPKSLRRRTTLRPNPSFKIITIDASLQRFSFQQPVQKQPSGLTPKEVSQRTMQERAESKHSEPRLVSFPGGSQSHYHAIPERSVPVREPKYNGSLPKVAASRASQGSSNDRDERRFRMARVAEKSNELLPRIRQQQNQSTLDVSIGSLGVPDSKPSSR